MAHTCPVCGITCHCNGDIDDLCLDFEDDVMACVHCEEYEEDDEPEYLGCDADCGYCPYDPSKCEEIGEDWCAEWPLDSKDE
jgi:hypothetical protein